MTKNRIMSMLKTVKCAIKGIVYAIKNERNMRIHTVATFYVMLFSTFFKMSVVEYAILIVTIAMVITSEMFNSAIESLIDLCAKDYNTTAKAAKDIAAGAVLIVAMGAVGVGIALFSKKEAYISMWVFFCKNPIISILGIILLMSSYLYVFWGPTEIKNKIQSGLRELKNKNNSNLRGESDGKKD